MLNIITQFSKYLLVILTAVYAMKCFTVFRAKYDFDRGSVYMVQNVLMFLIHFIFYLLIYLNTKDMKVIVFYFLQVVLFVCTLVFYGVMYRRASRLIINNMCFLLMIGFVELSRLDSADYPVSRQFMIAVVAIVISLAVPVIIEKGAFLKKIGPVYGVLGIIMIISVFIPGVGKNLNGATGWISVGPVSLQPSELAKIVFVFFIAAMLCRRTDFKYIVIISACAAIHVLILVAAKDLGAALIFFTVYVIMLYIATGKLRYLGLGFGGLAAAAAVAYRLFAHVRVRVQAWRYPWSDYQASTYQIAQSLFAISTGGWFGTGFYKGMPEITPIAGSDFIFTAIVEEMGALFGICLLLIYISCLMMFFNISLKITDSFYKLLAMGLSAAYGVQVLLCVGGVVKFIPHTGVTLPLISYGGSSILSTILVFSVIQGLYLLKQREVHGDVKVQ
ncbi:MAG: FtsW/RodA/SpoVE family cell cycle protein [Clostridiales bacterium]|nr:FtsW/RodA/SpoVE family cell cycle protein [Clostridiales bacterium]MDY3746633.1 FtsW/RodA/SpoVE family cell cycle protein [Lachnospiraceae bacterium]